MPTAPHDVRLLLDEFDRAVAYTDELWADLTHDQVTWRPSDDSSAIGWHLGHQAAVAHFMVRNLTAAEPSIDAELDRLMDSATPEPGRGALPSLDVLRNYRTRSAERLHVRIGDIDAGNVGAPRQLRAVAVGLVTAVINHEYQHSQWIGEVRARDLGLDMPDRPVSDVLTEVDGYLMIA